MIKLKDVVYEYPGKLAVKGISFEIQPNTVTAVVGPNGAGKTTLLRCMVGLDKPFSGTIELFGTDVIANPREAHKKIGFLQDIFGLYNSLKVWQCLDHFSRLRSDLIPNRKQRIEEISNLLGLTILMDKRASELSRGMRQRVGIAQALMHDPEVLVLDEPASGLDPESRAELTVVVKKLQSLGKTIIVSSHILTELEDYSTHMLVVKNGRIAHHSSLKANKDSDLFKVHFADKSLLSQSEFIQELPYTIVENSADYLVLEVPNDVSPSQALKTILQHAEVDAFYPDRRSMQDKYLDIIKSAKITETEK